MKTDILTPKDLFGIQVRYAIPPFQRPYVWTQDKQWEPLWNDMRNVAENYLEKLEELGGLDNKEVEAEQRTNPHFLGTIVLQHVPTPTKHIGKREVIDGQQRVTTLQLLLDAIQLICEEKDLGENAKWLLKFVTNGDTAEAHHTFKLWPTRADQDAFRHTMDNRLAIRGFEDSLIVEAHEFFQLQVRQWIGNCSSLIEHRMNALVVAAMTKLQMVVIDLNPQDDPNVIFETLNARGTPLEQSDLIKNFVLSTNRESNLWEGLDDEWWREEVRQGRLHRLRLDMLINYWLTMRTSAEVGPSEVFDVFHKQVDECNLIPVMSAVKEDLENYRRFETKSSRTHEEDIFHYRMDAMQVGVITPVLLLLLSTEHEVRIRAFHALESFLVRRMICRQTTKDYNRLILDLAEKLQQDSGLQTADKVVAGFLKEQTADSREWPSDKTVADSITVNPLYRLLTRKRLRLVLEGIEGRLRLSPKSEQPDVPKELTIEHLMPQGWKGNWPLPPGTEENRELAEDERNKLIHTIGNLTLANRKLNSSMSNSPWEDKRNELEGHSTLMLNKELILHSCWDEDSIRDRSKEMAKLISECWPGPDSRVWQF